MCNDNNYAGQDIQNPSNNLALYGLILTAIYLLCGAAIYLTRRCEFHNLKLNELGDFLAGYFGPLALAWLVLGFFQQKKELKLNTNALLLQFEELRDSVAQQKKIVRISEQSRKDEISRGIEASKPAFALEYKGGTGHIDSHPVHRYFLINNGPTIYEVDLELVANILQSAPGFTNCYTTSWETGGLRELRIAFEDLHDGIFAINYTDKNSHKGRSEFEIIRNADSPTATPIISERRTTFEQD